MWKFTSFLAFSAHSYILLYVFPSLDAAWQALYFYLCDPRQADFVLYPDGHR